MSKEFDDLLVQDQLGRQVALWLEKTTNDARQRAKQTTSSIPTMLVPHTLAHARITEPSLDV